MVIVIVMMPKDFFGFKFDIDPRYEKNRSS